MIALKEERSLPLLADRRGEQDGGVLGGPLLGVAHLAARDLEDDGSDVELARRAHGGAGGVVGHDAHVDRRDGEARDLTFSARAVEREDRGRQDPQRLGGLADRVPRGVLRVALPEDGRPDERVDHLGAEAGGVRDDDAAVETGRAGEGQRLSQLERGRIEVHGNAPGTRGILMQAAVLASVSLA